MIIAWVVILLTLGSVLFYLVSPWQLTPLASNWGTMDTTIQITALVTGAVFVAVNLFLAWVILRYRHRAGRRADFQPENKRLEGWLTLVTGVGIAALLAPGLWVWGDFVRAPEEAHRVEVVGQQWRWSFRLPGEDGEFGRVDPRALEADNPFGLGEDPAGLDDRLVMEPRLLLPQGQPVQLRLRSKDVLHNFQVANFRAKMDLVPGQVSHFWLTPTEPGDYQVVCAELCGIAHFAMRARIDVVAPEVFEAWRDGLPTQADWLARANPDLEAGRAHYASCAACHGASGGGNAAIQAPPLAGLTPDYLYRQLELFRRGARGTHAEDGPGQQMRPFALQLPDEAAIGNVAAYIATFEPAISPPAEAGDSRRGAGLYRTCAHCHGARGEGVAATRGPPLAGLPDWYLIRQLEHFREGIRGRHADDPYGNQMVDMAQMLVNRRAVEDVVAHITRVGTGTEEE
ncbi:c-type cytochrome [Halomonas pacifica]|uniref:c-type cytochrome n=1 Tax=Bisbaumannia pacifica TaxID=77098 RepID=UPI0023586A34|nr:c-type cytochrome [Halomonas pacifica]MDC8804726.1 c-type cytochrome [Halomonas pacifica]